MESIFYVLLLVALNSDGDLALYEPVPYATEMRCEFNRSRMLNSPKPDTTVLYEAVCVKVVLSQPEKMAMEKGMI